ncbi:MAG: alpha/beta fold hydrolase [Planctomycetota bacterium]|jgi:hypothetical protein
MIGHFGQRALLCVLGLTLLSSAGCGGLAAFNLEHIDKGLVVVLPGIDGPSFGTLGVMSSVAANTEMAVGQFDWTIPFGLLLNQTAQGRNRDMAKLLAGRIVDYREAYPGRPVYLIGHSGGTAIAVWTAEYMPPTEKLDGLFLLASSLSAGYDLSRAMRNLNGPIVNVYSSGDSALLSLGTSLIGTMDGVHGRSAGKVGFTRPVSTWGGPSQLVQIPWTPAMRRMGYGGDHFSCCSGQFIKEMLVPQMTSGAAATSVAIGPGSSPAPRPDGQPLYVGR